MATTTNYGWTTPNDTDLVKDGAAAIRTLGSSADTTVKNLNPGTTAGDIDYYTSSTAKARVAIGSAGQVLRVNSGGNAPEWATTADQTPLTTKGDLFTFTTIDARLGVGANGTVLTADSAETTGLKWAAPAGNGLTLITNQTFTTSAAVNVNDVFSSTYRNYKIIMEITSASASGSTTMRMRVGGADNSAANYFSNRVFGQSAAVTSQGNTAAGTSIANILEFDTGTSSGSYDIIAPFETANTAIMGLNNFRYTSFYQHTTMLTGQLTVTTSYTGFSLLPASGTITGRVLVYGYAN